MTSLFTPTLVVMAATVVMLALYDVWVAVKRGWHGTISWSMYTISKEYPIVPFAIGVLCGHFFWSQVC